MNLVGGPDWAFWFFSAVLVAAAVQDILQNRISNLLVLALLGGGFVVAGMEGMSWSLGGNGAVFVAILIFGSILFSMGIMGGGDVKLLAAAAFWFPPDDVPRMLLAVMLFGGLLVLAWLPVKIARSKEKKRVMALLKEKSLPYGVAIAGGAIFVGYEVTTRLPDMFTL